MNHTVVLEPLQVRDVVSVQTQVGRHKKWDLAGEVVEVLPFDQYHVRMAGLERVMLRNSNFLQKIFHFRTLCIHYMLDLSIPSWCKILCI